jgi:tetratricopeptide (TPR) repeat protein
MVLIESSAHSRPRAGDDRRFPLHPLRCLAWCLVAWCAAAAVAVSAEPAEDTADPIPIADHQAAPQAAEAEEPPISSGVDGGVGENTAEHTAESAPEPASEDEPAATALDDDMSGPGDDMVSIEDMLDGSADPLNHVEAQIRAREFDPAVDSLEEHIATVEAASHRFERDLIRPLTLLGDAYTGKGEFTTALEHYQRAVHLSRVNDGLNSPAQVEIVYREANVLKALGEFQQANDREEYAYHVLTRAHAPMDEKLLPGIYHLANWYERTSNVFAARTLYQHAVEIINANDKANSPEAIPAFQGLASSYRMERFPAHIRNVSSTSTSNADATFAPGAVSQQISVNNFPAGEAALQRVVRIRQSQQPFDQLALAEAVLDLADWYMLFDKTQRSVPLYAHAWELLAGIDGYDVASRFAQPELLYFPAPENPSAPPANERGEPDTGYVEIAFDVTDTGYVRSLKTVASLPDGLMDFRVRKSVRVARYRPMLIDGVPVAKQAHTYRHEFPYFQERGADEDDNRSAETAASG